MNQKQEIYDVTLREGMQCVGASFTVEDKVRLARLLDEIGVSYLEGGQPGSNPKDDEFYRRMEEQPLRHAKLVAFGPTCRVGCRPEEDASLTALLDAHTPVVCVFGKSWDFQVTKILETTKQENIERIADTVSYLKSFGREVVFDAEHFFDGYRSDAVYATKSIQAAWNAGADWIVLCDTNGGCLPHQIRDIVHSVKRDCPSIRLGLHCHNDGGMADANTIVGTLEGVSMVQLSLSGWGERCGNADFFTVVPNLQLKLGQTCIADEQMEKLVSYSYLAADILNVKQNPKSPFVGVDAFRHKAGMHIAAVVKDPASFEHIAPERVGATRQIMLSEVSGRAAVRAKLRHLLPLIGYPALSDDKMLQIVERLKELEFEGYQFESANASFELEVRRILDRACSFFQLKSYRVITSEVRDGWTESASAIVDLFVEGIEEVTAANGIGPVDALDRALRKALQRFYPVVSTTRLVDYRVRVLDSRQATASKVRVLIESTDGIRNWMTVGVSGDIIGASWRALTDAYDYLLLQGTANPELA